MPSFRASFSPCSPPFSRPIHHCLYEDSTIQTGYKEYNPLFKSLSPSCADDEDVDANDYDDNDEYNDDDDDDDDNDDDDDYDNDDDDDDDDANDYDNKGDGGDGNHDALFSTSMTMVI